jgi:sorbitol-specific phosphotransferase system component IIA
VKIFALAISLLLLSVTAFAQTYSNANLNGSYTLQTTRTTYDSWAHSASCTFNGQTFTYSGGGQTVSTAVSSGVVTFDGIGSVTTTYTDAGEFDQTLSNASVVITFNSQCVPTINNGSAVFDPSRKITQAGTYQVQSTGSGILSIKGQSSFQLAATTPTTNISNTMLFTFPNGVPHEINSTGIAIRQLIVSQ